MKFQFRRVSYRQCPSKYFIERCKCYMIKLFALQTLATGVAQLLQADIQKYQWEIIGIGVACYVRDYKRREVSVQLIDPGYLGSSMERWKLIVYEAIIL